MTPPDSSAHAAPFPAAAASMDRARPDMRLLSLLALGPMVVDVNQGSLAFVAALFLPEPRTR